MSLRSYEEGSRCEGERDKTEKHETVGLKERVCGGDKDETKAQERRIRGRWN